MLPKPCEHWACCFGDPMGFTITVMQSNSSVEGTVFTRNREDFERIRQIREFQLEIYEEPTAALNKK